MDLEVFVEDFEDRTDDPIMANHPQMENQIQKRKDTFQCDLCDFETNREKYLNNHIKSHHSDKKNSSSEFTSISKVVTIINLKVKERKCDFCHFSTRSGIVLEKHVEENHQINNEISNKTNHICDAFRQSPVASEFNPNHLMIKTKNLLFCRYQ